MSSSHPSLEERVFEWESATEVNDILGGKIVKLQENKDDGGADGIIEFKGRQRCIESRRKGYPNHEGILRYTFEHGWDDCHLVKDGVWINERTLRNHRGSGVFYIVEIKDFSRKLCYIDEDKIELLLKKPPYKQQCYNSNRSQSVKGVPVEWFVSVNYLRKLKNLGQLSI